MLSKHWDKRSRLSWLTHLLSLWLIFCKTLPLPIVPKWCSSGLARVMLLLLPHTLVLGDLVSFPVFAAYPSPEVCQAPLFPAETLPAASHAHWTSLFWCAPDISNDASHSAPSLRKGDQHLPTHAHANQAHESPHFTGKKTGVQRGRDARSGHAQLVRG